MLVDIYANEKLRSKPIDNPRVLLVPLNYYFVIPS